MAMKFTDRDDHLVIDAESIGDIFKTQFTIFFTAAFPLALPLLWVYHQIS